MGMVVKHVTMTDKDVALSPNAAKRRWTQAKCTGPVPTIKARTFAAHIGFLDNSEVDSEDEMALVEMMDNVLPQVDKPPHHGFRISMGPLLGYPDIASPC
eukprot:scaffold76486_cov33-Attheya_sp.AAC.3